MKRLLTPILILTLLFILAANSFGQNFTASARADTSHNYNPNTPSTHYIDVVNLTRDSLRLNFHYDRGTAPSNWIVSMCVGSSCYPEFITDVEYVIPPLTADSCALDVYGTSEGGYRIAMNIRRVGTNDSLVVSFTHHILPVEEQTNPLPTKSSLGVVYPNPFNSSTHLAISMARPATLGLSLFDISGREVANLNKHVSAGVQSVDLTQLFVNSPSGTYFLQVTGAGNAQTHRIHYVR